MNKGNPVVVTGSAQGLGRAISLRLAAEGRALALVDVREERLAAVADEVRRAGAGDVRTEVADLSDSAGVVAIAERLEASAPFGLVNCAGIGIPAPFTELTVEAWNLTFAINLVAPFLLSQRLGAGMAGRGSGRIVNIASIGGKQGAAGLADYTASKAALISLTQAAAAEFGPAGVTVNAVCPGPVWTRQHAAAFGWTGEGDSTEDPGYEEFVTASRARTLLRQPTRLEDIAAAVAFLLSDDAARITAQAINVDSGMQVH